MSRAFLFALLVTHCLAQTISLSAPVSAPSDASKIISHDFPSLAFEISSFAEFAGCKSNPNTFSQKLVSAISSRVGQGLNIRVGGTSHDLDSYNPNLNAPFHKDPGGSGTNPKNLQLGPSFFESFGNFPGSKYTWMVPFKRLNAQNGLTDDAMTQTKLAIQAIGRDNLESFEIGNEVNLYPSQGGRPKTWDEADYVKEWLAGVDKITNTFSIERTKRFQALAFGAGYDQSKWSVSSAFDDGINADNDVRSVSLHYYQAVGPKATLENTLMNHTAIVTKLTNSILPGIQYLSNHNPNIPMVLGEVGNSLGGKTDPAAAEALKAVFGAALWQTDFMLYAMSINVGRVNMQQGPGYLFNLWNVSDLAGQGEQFARPAYYAQLFAADFIGTDTGNEFRVKTLLQQEKLAAYAGYVKGKVARAAVVNLEVWKKAQTGAAPVKTLELAVPDGVNKVKVQYLSAPGADSEDQVSWAGQVWNNHGDAKPLTDGTRNVDVKDGKVQFEVRASEAAMVSWD